MKKLFAVIGDPISHSMSPVMHNHLFQKYGIDAHYHALHVKKGDLKEAVLGLKAIGISGFNVTIPHKSDIIPFLDKVDSLAESIGAVNTVVNEEGKLVGYNTDGAGFVRGLTSELSAIKDKSVLIIGAGGAARAIYFTMADMGVNTIDIANRTVSKVQTLVEECPYSVSSKALQLEEAAGQLDVYDVVIQTTSIGMSPNVNEEPISLKSLKQNTFVSDIIYNPLETLMLKNAKKKKATNQNGLNMFVYQGALAFEKWTGIFPNTDQMKNIVLQQLGGRKC